MPMHPALQIAQLLRVLKTVNGRKKLQKLVHILQEFGHPFPEQFEYSHYGMYSRELRSELSLLVTEDLVSERENQNQFGHPSFTFEATPKLSSLLDELDLEPEPSWAEAATKLQGYSSLELEGISTILFLRRCGLQGEQLKQRLLSLKPHLSEQYDFCERETNCLAHKFAAQPAATLVA
jgi:uncharacterized protein YwgA